MGEKFCQFSFPVVEYMDSELVIKNGDGRINIGDKGMVVDNSGIMCVNSKFIFEKNGFQILNVSGDEILIKNAPLKMQDTYFNYLYEKKNAQLLLKNDILYTNYIDYEIRNGQFNWNQGKLLLGGNQIRINEVNMEIMETSIIIKRGKQKLEIAEGIEIEDWPIRIRNMKNDLITIDRNIVRLEGNVFIKNGRFYNECFTLEPNSIKITQAQQRIKQNDIFYEESNIELDEGSNIKMGEVRMRGGKRMKVEGENWELEMGDRLEMSCEGQSIRYGGLDRVGNRVVFESGETKMIEHEGELYVRLGKERKNMGNEMKIGEERYVSEIDLIERLMERVSKLESYFLEKNLS